MSLLDKLAALTSHIQKGASGTAHDLTTMMMGGGSNQPVIPRMGGNVGPTQKQVYSGIRQGVNSISGAEAISKFHDRPGIVSGLEMMAALPIVAGGAAHGVTAADKAAHAAIGVKGAEAARSNLAKMLVHESQNAELMGTVDRLKRGETEFHTTGSHPNTVIRSVTDPRTPILNHHGEPTYLGDVSKFYQDGTMPHFWNAVDSMERNIPDRGLHHHDLQGTFLTGVNKEDRDVAWEQAHVIESMRGKGIYKDAIELRKALAQGQIGSNAKVSGSFSENSGPAAYRQFSEGHINFDPYTLRQQLTKAAFILADKRLPASEQALGEHAQKVWDDLEPYLQYGDFRNLPPDRMEEARKTLAQAMPFVFPRGGRPANHPLSQMAALHDFLQ